VRPGTLLTDAERRDFTVNTLLENLHTGEARDPTGRGRADLAARLLRTPTDPAVTFTEDPLRMLRACRFAAKLGFVVEENTRAALQACAHLCRPEHGVSYERIRDELSKTLLTADAPRGLEMMRATGLLGQFTPELARMHGVTQNRFHKYDVWTHTLAALANLPPDAPLHVRLAALFHDIGKPATRTVDPDTGEAHFYTHQDVGAEITRTVLSRLRFPSDAINTVTELVALHMRYGEYRADVWADASVRRLIRAVGLHRRDLFIIARADISACNTEAMPAADLAGLEERMERLEAEAQVTRATSPLDGKAIMGLLKIPPGPAVGTIKNALTDAVVAGFLAPEDVAGAERMARELWAQIASGGEPGAGEA
jgi:poly(A) polymerase